MVSSHADAEAVVAATRSSRHSRSRSSIRCLGFVLIFLVSFSTSIWRILIDDHRSNLPKDGSLLFLLHEYARNNSQTASSTFFWSGPYPWSNNETETDEQSNSIADDDNLEEDETTTIGGKKKKLLYTVTTLSEYNSGRRNLVKGSDRFQETLLPILTESVYSMLDDTDYHVDVYLICGYVLSEDRRAVLRQALPATVGLEIWEDALPLNYPMKDFVEQGDDSTSSTPKNTSVLEDHARGLARQHRFVLKDKLPYYDVFVQFEDDMLIKGAHVTNYANMAEHLRQLRTEAAGLEGKIEALAYNKPNYTWPLTPSQLKRTMPGFMRVEAVLNETLTPIPSLKYQVPVDLVVDGVDGVNGPSNHSTTVLLDASVCCHVSESIATARLPLAPIAHNLITWETQILPLGVRHMPNLLKTTTMTASASHNDTHAKNYTLDWVVLQRGTPYPFGLADYWSGTDGYYQNDTVDWRPATGERKYLNNQGGYIATQWQLVEWDLEVCQGGGYLPPFEGYNYGAQNGLDLRDVEYWSGGLQLVTKCGMQRIMNLHPDFFPRHILYHTSNNKQEQLQNVKERFTRLDDLYGMLNTVKKNAIRNLQEPPQSRNMKKELTGIGKMLLQKVDT